jgi:hypothetical protein
VLGLISFSNARILRDVCQLTSYESVLKRLPFVKLFHARSSALNVLHGAVFPHRPMLRDVVLNQYHVIYCFYQES